MGAINLDRYNERIQQDVKDIIAEIKAEGKTLDIQQRENSPSKTASLPKVKGSTRKKDGVVSQISVKFPRVLIYTHKGAGKGRGGNKGSSWLDKYGVKKTTDPKSLGKMGKGGRKAKPFINNVLDSDRGISRLATTAAEELGDAIVGNILVK